MYIHIYTYVHIYVFIQIDTIHLYTRKYKRKNAICNSICSGCVKMFICRLQHVTVYGHDHECVLT
jgi:hypothetical protein